MSASLPYGEEREGNPCKRAHPSYDQAFKIEAVRFVQTSGKSMSQVSKDLG